MKKPSEVVLPNCQTRSIPNSRLFTGISIKINNKGIKEKQRNSGIDMENEINIES